MYPAQPIESKARSWQWATQRSDQQNFQDSQTPAWIPIRKKKKKKSTSKPDDCCDQRLFFSFLYICLGIFWLSGKLCYTGKGLIFFFLTWSATRRLRRSRRRSTWQPQTSQVLAHSRPSPRSSGRRRGWCRGRRRRGQSQALSQTTRPESQQSAFYYSFIVGGSSGQSEQWWLTVE